MLLVKFSAEEVRKIRKALDLTDAELTAKCLALVLEKIDVTETSKTLKPPPKAAAITWVEARNILQNVLGSNLRVPASPDGVWFSRVGRGVRSLSAAELTELATYAKERMRLPIDMEFLVNQRTRILAGEWAIRSEGASPAPPTRAAWLQDDFPDE